MKIGCVKEIKLHEYRVGLTPSNVRSYVAHGHQVMIEKGAGEGSAFCDEEYAAAGATIADNAKTVWDNSQLIVKVKEPLESEYQYFHKDLIIYAYFHMAAVPQLANELIKKHVHSVAYETVTDDLGDLPLLKPMSEIAGRLSIQEGAKYLEKPYGGRGVLLPGVPGVAKGHVTILGTGVVGTNACKLAVGMGADVTIIGRNNARLAQLDDMFGARVQTLFSTEESILSALKQADLIIGAVLITGASTPKLIKRKYLSQMKPGSVIVDVSIDQGGCCETSKITYHDDPVYTVDGVIHYCVGNMPGAVPRTSTISLTNATTQFGLIIADNGLKEACKKDKRVAEGVNIYGGHCVHENIANSLNLKYTNLSELI